MKISTYFNNPRKYHRNYILLCLFIAQIIVLPSCKKSELVFQLNPLPNSRIVILGNTFAERLQHHNYFETLLYKSFPEQQLTVRNMAWSADEVNLQPRPLHFGTLDEHLNQQKPDIIFACFGLNEAFKGPDSLEAFKLQLSGFLQHLQQQQYNGETSPMVILVSPIAHEKLGGYLPDPTLHNKSLKLYTNGMQQVAKELDIPFINLFQPTTGLTEDDADSLTINGIHLNEKGYLEVSEIMARALGFSVASWSQDPEFTGLKKVIDHKNRHFFYQFRAVNGEYIYGRRKEPFGVISFPPEFEALDQIVQKLDTIIWSGSQRASAMNLQKVQNIINSTSQFEVTGPEYSKHPPTTDQFMIQEGYEIELFASEIDFPIENPVTLTFDPKGRMWLATMPSYPHYYPGSPPNDKIVILEDTNKDGKADQHTVFADSLYLPLGFELGDGGVYLTQAPDFVFLKDTNGDDIADYKQILMHGFGTEDSHHAISAYTWGQDGALYMHEGTFLHTQVETPYGPVRSAYGTTFRYDPRNMKLDPYISIPYANPWSNVFMRDGTHLIGDASNGNNYFATPLTVAIDYPKKHVMIKDFPTTKVRPTSGHEIVSSRHFPESAQGNYLQNNTIGFQGIKQYKISEDGSGIIAHETEPLLQSKDLNFRPVDLQFGPDGALYVVDWFNPLIGHMQHSLRDPGRDHSHGRIWRITHKNKELLRPVDLTSLTINQLLNQLLTFEDRVRYRTRIQLRQYPASDVIPALEQWHKNLDPTDQNFEQHKMEALWVFQQFHHPNEILLEELLNAKSHHIRAAATRVLFYWHEKIDNAQEKLTAMSQDPSPKVRLEAIAALSHFKTEATVNALLATIQLPVDYYIDYALKESFKHLQPVWIEMFKKDKDFLKDEPEKANFLLHPLSSPHLLALPEYYFKDDPEGAKFARAPLSQEDYNTLSDATAVTRFWISRKDVPDTTREKGLKLLSERTGKDEAAILLEEIIRLDQDPEDHGLSGLSGLLVKQDHSRIMKMENQLMDLAENAKKHQVKELSYALLNDIKQDISYSRQMSKKSLDNHLAFIGSVKWTGSEKVKSAIYPELKSVIQGTSSAGYNRQQRHEIQATAIKSLACMDHQTQEVVTILSSFIQPKGQYTEEAVQSLLMIPDEKITGLDLKSLNQNITSFINNVPERDRVKNISNNLVLLGKKIAALLPEDEAKPLISSLSKAEKTTILISTLPEKMLFDLTNFTVIAGKSVEIIFSNPDNMPHNLLIVQPNSLEVVGIMSEEMAKTADGFKKNFIPDTDKVLFSTPLVNSGQEYKLTFMAPEQPGNYPFVCTFPGHWKMMNGIMKVEKPILP